MQSWSDDDQLQCPTCAQRYRKADNGKLEMGPCAILFCDSIVGLFSFQSLVLSSAQGIQDI
jgi:hypothetical protein